MEKLSLLWRKKIHLIGEKGEKKKTLSDGKVEQS